LLDGRTGEPVVPPGTIGDRWTESGLGRWNLDLGEISPQLTLLGDDADNVELLMPRFDNLDGSGEVIRRGVPARRVGGRRVTTVCDIMLAQYGVSRPGLPGEWPTGYDDASQPYTPAWQEAITSVPARSVLRTAREMANN